MTHINLTRHDARLDGDLRLRPAKRTRFVPLGLLNIHHSKGEHSIRYFKISTGYFHLKCFINIVNGKIDGVPKNQNS